MNRLNTQKYKNTNSYRENKLLKYRIVILVTPKSFVADTPIDWNAPLPPYKWFIEIENTSISDTNWLQNVQTIWQDVEICSASEWWNFSITKASKVSNRASLQFLTTRVWSKVKYIKNFTLGKSRNLINHLYNQGRRRSTLRQKIML